MTLVIQRFGQIHFPKALGLAGNDSERRAWDPGRPASPDADLKLKEDFDYVSSRGCEIADGAMNWQHAIEL